MPRWRRDGGVDLDLPVRLWGKSLPKVIFDPAWLEANEERIRADPYNVTVVEREVEGWRDEDHRLSEDTEDELERYEREITRLNRANRKRSVMATEPSVGITRGGPAGGSGSGSTDSGSTSASQPVSSSSGAPAAPLDRRSRTSSFELASGGTTSPDDAANGMMFNGHGGARHAHNHSTGNSSNGGGFPSGDFPPSANSATAAATGGKGAGELMVS